VGVADEFRASFGEDFFDRKSPHAHGMNWRELCICGHLDRYHSPSIGGGYVLKDPWTVAFRGETINVTAAFFGCVGALKPRGFEEITETADREAMTKIERINPTCPCDDFRAVAMVDRPNRFFNQRMPTDRVDPDRHPFQTGVRAFMTHLSRRKQAMADPSWFEAELDRRFTWTEGKRICATVKCTETDDVFPVFVDGERSELRCSKHR
jgi:hypothetical protein